jgi:hypothetical protein
MMVFLKLSNPEVPLGGYGLNDLTMSINRQGLKNL